MAVNAQEAWTLAFSAPDGRPLAAGDYADAQRASTSPAPWPGMDIVRADRRCNTVSGRFSILHIAFDAHDMLSRLQVRFEQHCDGKPATLGGSIDLVGGVV